MKIKESWLCWGVALIPALVASPELIGNVQDSASVSYQNRQEERQQERSRSDAIRHAQSVKSDSQVALERVGSACVPVFYKKNGKPAYLTENSVVMAGLESDQVLGDGSLICTELGDTAEVWDGRAYQVKRVSAQDRGDYLKKYRLLQD